jgi:hypothetical protein
MDEKQDGTNKMEGQITNGINDGRQRKKKKKKKKME